jgi:PAS domain S-box-containing protein
MEPTKILIVEDETITAMELELNLQAKGHEVVAKTDNGEDAIEKAEQLKPDLILMDIRLRGDMDGIEASHIIRERFQIPVVFTTAYLDQERIDRSKLALPFGYVLKPVREQDLNVTMEMALYVNKMDTKRRKAEEDLRIHQFELEQQNEELRVAQIDLEELHIKYFELFELAPVGYVTLNEIGLFTDVNLTCCTMFGAKRSILLKSKIERFIEKGSQDTFYHHKQKAIDTGTQQICELTLVKKNKTGFTARLESRALFNDQNEFIQMNTNIIDIEKR